MKLMLKLIAIVLSAPSCLLHAADLLPPSPSPVASLSVSEHEIILVREGVIRCRFARVDGKRWKIASLDVWDKAESWHEAFTSTHGEFLYLGTTPDFDLCDPHACLYADSFEKISTGGTTGVRFAGVHDLSGVPFRWSACYFFDAAVKIPLLHCVCVGALETIEPIVLMTSLLKHRVNRIFLKYLALADRRHLIVYPRNHTDKRFDYPFIPMELVPQRDSFAMYMGGAAMIENVMFKAAIESSKATPQPRLYKPRASDSPWKPDGG